jgi:hypothetical protein
MLFSQLVLHWLAVAQKTANTDDSGFLGVNASLINKTTFPSSERKCRFNHWVKAVTFQGFACVRINVTTECFFGMSSKQGTKRGAGIGTQVKLNQLISRSGRHSWHGEKILKIYLAT